MGDLKAIANTIRERFPEAVQDIVEFRGEVTVVVDRKAIVEVATFCRDTEGLLFNFLSDLTAVDYWPEEPRFAVCYMLYSMLLNHSLRAEGLCARRRPPLFRR